MTATLSIGVGNNPGGAWGAGAWRNLEELMRRAASFLASWPPCSHLATPPPLTHCSLCESLVAPWALGQKPGSSGAFEALGQLLPPPSSQLLLHTPR